MTEVITDYDSFVAALDTRRVQLGLTHQDLEEMGFARAHPGKMLAPHRTKLIGPQSFNLFLQFLALEFVPKENAEMAEKMRVHWENRSGRRAVRSMVRMRSPVWLFSTRSAKAAVGKRWRKTSPEGRSRLARKAAQARWRRHRRMESAQQSRSCYQVKPKRNRQEPWARNTATKNRADGKSATHLRRCCGQSRGLNHGGLSQLQWAASLQGSAR